ncbi:MAG: hypothetical protein IJ724_08130 [Muribaculaceae bacterium]|nr:hypothetical protein [Muribaculaceae bacterium]MBR1726597.1 hypothetical protein [Muribaculaceae bacterium]
MNHKLIKLSAMLAIIMLAQNLSAQQNVDELKEQRFIEREAYNTARALNTVDAWEIFINNYPESFYIEQARKLRDAAIVKHYCNDKTTLAQLTEYIDENTAHEPRIRTFYANLVNNPTHSYRFEHMDVGFNGCTGRVDEHITFADGTKPRDCYFIFDDKGLLVKSSIMGSRPKPVVTTYTYRYDNLHGYALKQMNRAGIKSDFEVFYDNNDKLEIITSHSGQKWVMSYNDNGAIARVIITDGASRRTLVYNDGYIIREETAGKALRYLYDYDSATFKKYLIGINEVDRPTPGGERKFDYQIDIKGRITRCTISQDGKEVMTITRKFSN